MTSFSTCVGRSASNRTRSASKAASARSWVTSSAAVGRARQASSSSSRLRAAIAGSSETNGSSSRTSSGSIANARAMDARRAMPSDSVGGKASRNGARSSVRSRSSARSGFSVCCANRMFWRTVRHGSRRGSWNTVPMRGIPAPCQSSVPSIVGIQAADDPQQRRLAAAGRPDQCHDLARAECEIDAAQHRQIAAVGAEGFALDAKPQDHLRHRVAQRSSGCRPAHSITCTTTMKASV